MKSRRHFCRSYPVRVAFPERWQSQVGHESLILGFFKKIIYFSCSGSSLLHGLSPAVASEGYFIVAVHWLLIGVASLCRAQAIGCWGFSSFSHGLSSCSSQALEHRFNSCGPRHFCSEACGIFQDQGSNLCLLQWLLYHWATREPPGSPQGSFELWLGSVLQVSISDGWRRGWENTWRVSAQHSLSPFWGIKSKS